MRAYRGKGGYLLSLGLEGNEGQGVAFTVIRAWGDMELRMAIFYH